MFRPSLTVQEQAHDEMRISALNRSETLNGLGHPVHLSRRQSSKSPRSLSAKNHPRPPGKDGTFSEKDGVEGKNSPPSPRSTPRALALLEIYEINSFSVEGEEDVEIPQEVGLEDTTAGLEYPRWGPGWTGIVEWVQASLLTR